MGDFKMRLTTDMQLMDQLQAAKKESPRKMQRVFKANDKKIVPPLLKELGKEPPKPKFPRGKFPWTNDKQRIAVMIKLKGKRYRRTHKLSKGWQARRYFTKTGMIYSVKNPAKIAKYVYGHPTARLNRQQRFHRLIGWYTGKQLDRVLKKHSKKATKILEVSWAEVAGSFFE